MLYPAIYFSGSFGPGSAMEYAAIWLLKEVMPLVWHANPAVNIYLVGRGNTDNLKKISDPRVMITGEVPDTLPYVKTADAAVVPLWFESGTRFKILEAAACRTPVVSTTLGAEGLSVAHEKNILISDKPQGFADAILKIIADKKLAQQLSENAYHDIAEKFDISRAVKEAQQILMKLA
ncbi:MAG: hypothetical protein A2754_03040 [Candidatus Magasanikbacteria bacterium RIFCSPHIGHO2_01_FULL_47_8]|uniref:Glycosyl transferase family 1 domain-containing protein n=1 Tax=Candidatus Magasanikbacteria bacterium RIFCSPHIGHO2_01_FULL_47_8 TaxID=1798673 RepID=A0A1F6MB49_9BACT|nr:MAG: hypothetical protein A2754_03040 [Candidatus Magasanikbacteria bacterium RIFCSPHIGHO2_01_FULL_47_8]